MPLLNTDPSTGTTSPAPPELPEGWRHTDDLDWDAGEGDAGRRRWRLLALVAVLVAVGSAGLIVGNAASHYSRGVAALRERAYARAATELSAARLLVFPYRDSQRLADGARRELEAQSADRAASQARLDLVNGALREGASRLEAADAPGVLAVLQPLAAADLRAALIGSSAAREAATALAGNLTTAAEAALREMEWGRAGRLAQALLILDPASDKVAALAEEAKTGQRLSERLGKAQAAARRGEWRTALRRALAVTAVRPGFPGAAAVIAEARRALRPKPAPKPTTAATTAPAPSSGGSSSGSPSQPPPP